MAPKDKKVEGDSKAAIEARAKMAGGSIDADAVKGLDAACRTRLSSAFTTFTANHPQHPLTEAYNGASTHDAKRQVMARYIIQAGDAVSWCALSTLL